jgi:cysteine desulfurase
MFNYFKKKKEKGIYLDYASTTPVLKEVLSIMNRYASDDFYNPSSLYRGGVLVKREIESAKKEIKELLNTQAAQVVFTASGTESNNLAILGMRNDEGKFDNMHFVTTNIEHTSTLSTFKEVERLGGEVTYIKVNSDGLIDPRDLLHMIKPNTKLISIILVHNEIGIIQDIKQISKMVRKSEKNLNIKVPIHIDASQAPNYLQVDMVRMGVDMITLDAQKIYGPKGIGVLIVKKGIELKPLVFGGKQEGGLRAGTENVGHIMGFTEALKIADRDRENETDRLMDIREEAIDRILAEFKGSSLNGSRENRVANNINICFPGLDAEYAVVQLDYANIQCSYASSCNSLGDSLTSYTVDALGKEGCGSSSLRLTLGRGTVKADMETLIKELKKIVLK